jgi:rhodanese-related sulfurtransferase
MAKRYSAPIALAFILVASVACAAPAATTMTSPISQPATGTASITRISADELAKMIAGPKDFTLVNVHIPYEGDLPNTDLSIPYNTIQDHLNELPGKDAKIVLYCRSGSMSDIAARRLVELGYQHIYDLTGGMQAWDASGRTRVYK